MELKNANLYYRDVLLQSSSTFQACLIDNQLCYTNPQLSSFGTYCLSIASSCSLDALKLCADRLKFTTNNIDLRRQWPGCRAGYHVYTLCRDRKLH